MNRNEVDELAWQIAVDVAATAGLHTGFGRVLDAVTARLLEALGGGPEEESRLTGDPQEVIHPSDL